MNLCCRGTQEQEFETVFHGQNTKPSENQHSKFKFRLISPKAESGTAGTSNTVDSQATCEKEMDFVPLFKLSLSSLKKTKQKKGVHSIQGIGVAEYRFMQPNTNGQQSKQKAQINSKNSQPFQNNNLFRDSRADSKLDTYGLKKKTVHYIHQSLMKYELQ